jgi:hypothetical protein
VENDSVRGSLNWYDHYYLFKVSTGSKFQLVQSLPVKGLDLRFIKSSYHGKSAEARQTRLASPKTGTPSTFRARDLKPKKANLDVQPQSQNLACRGGKASQQPKPNRRIRSGKGKAGRKNGGKTQAT